MEKKSNKNRKRLIEGTFDASGCIEAIPDYDYHSYIQARLFKNQDF